MVKINNFRKSFNRRWTFDFGGIFQLTTSNDDCHNWKWIMISPPPPRAFPIIPFPAAIDCPWVASYNETVNDLRAFSICCFPLSTSLEHSNGELTAVRYLQVAGGGIRPYPTELIRSISRKWRQEKMKKLNSEKTNKISFVNNSSRCT